MLGAPQRLIGSRAIDKLIDSVPRVHIHSMRRHTQNVNGSGNHSETSSVNGSGNYFEGSSSSSHPVVEPKKYDVFINHRGPDTKLIFVTHLEEALIQKNISPFVDKSLKEGEDSFEEINAAIRTAPVQLAIFSLNYAESAYCLDELVDMLERRKKHPDSVRFLPIFFNVKPKDLYKFDVPEKPFYKAFQKHKDKYSDERTSNWIRALNDAAKVKGFELSNLGGNTLTLKHNIVTRVQEILRDLGMSSSQNTSPVAHPADDRPPPDSAPPENEDETITFTPTDRPLRVLVLGNSGSVEDVVSHICGAGRRQTEVTDYEGLTESRSASPPMCLYHRKAEGNHRTAEGNHRTAEGNHRAAEGNDFTNVVKAFVDDRNSRWHGRQVVTMCLEVIGRRRLSEDLLPGSASRLHMVWYVCQTTLDFPNDFLWEDIMKTLCDIPLQIVVAASPGAAISDSEYRKILDQMISLFPEAQNSEELIVKFDRNLIVDFWRKCWESKTQGEIRNAARVIREVRKELGETGISIPQGIGNAAIPPEGSLLVGGQFLLRDFFCTYWEVPSLTSIHGVLREMTTFIEQTPEGTHRYRIRPGQFVKFCLQVAAVILYNLRDSDGNPRYVCDWPESSSEQSFQLLRTEINRCYARSFQRTDRTYDKMKVNHIQGLLQSIFEKRDFDFELLEGQERACWFCLSL